MKAPKHRKRARLTLEEFRRHKKCGIGIRVMPKILGVSKNHVQFLSAIDQDRFSNVTKDQFRSDYLAGISLFEIAEKYSIPKDYIGFMREHFDIPRLGAKFINRKKTEKPLTNRQKELIYGSLMGDAGKMSSSSIKMKQSIKQRPYLMWKFGELSEHISLKSLQEEKTFDKRYGKTYTGVRFYSHANTDVETIITQFYESGKKVITQQILDNLTAFSIAVWHMDDGNTDWSKVSKYPNSKPESKLCTDSFSLLECEMIVKWFKDRWNIISHTRRHRRTSDGTGYRVIFSTTETPKLFALIRPYIIPSMLYKVDYQAYLQKDSS